MDKLNILIAEDDAIIALSLKEMLQKMHYSVAGIAANGIEAVSKAKELKPDVILMDIKMPGMDGLEATREINKTHPVPVVVLTAYPTEDFINRASEEGVFAYLVKPVKERDLRPALTVAVDRFLEKLEDEKKLEEAKQGMKDQKTIDRAKWVLVEELGMSEERAYKKINSLSRIRNVKMADVAVLVMDFFEMLKENR